MNKLYLGGLIGLFILNLNACSKYDPIYGIAGNNTVEQASLTKDLVYIYDNDIYLVNQILSDQKRLTFNQFSTKTHVALSPNHDRIAYLNASGTPVIIDTSGTIIETLAYTNVKDLKYHANNGNPTLYMLYNNNIIFHPTSLSLNISSDPFSYVFPSGNTYTEIDAVDINDNLDIAFSYRYQEPTSTGSTYRYYYHGVGVNLFSTSFDYSKAVLGGNYNTSTTTYSAQTYPYYHLVKFNEDDQDVSLGSISNGNEAFESSYSLARYIYSGSSSTISTLNSPGIVAENYYNEFSEGEVASNEGQIQKYLKLLPANVPPPTGTTNTFTLNFPSSNNSPPTYFDWKP